MADLSQIQVNGTNYNVKDATARSSITTQSTEIVALNDMISDAWSSSSTPYAVGSYAIYNNKLWKCITANSVAPSEGSNWTEKSVCEELSAVNNLAEYVKVGGASGVTQLGTSSYASCIISLSMQNVGSMIGLVTVSGGTISVNAHYGGADITPYLTYSNGLCISSSNIYYYTALITEL